MNPLDMSFEEINTVSEQIQEEQGITEEEKFSKYLYKLEQNKEISEEERSAYIGVYRLIRQVEKDRRRSNRSLAAAGRRYYIAWTSDPDSFREAWCHGLSGR